MTISTHRARAMEKKVVKKLILTLILALGSIILLIFVGLPLLSRFVLLLSPKGTDTTQNTSTDSSILFAPTLNPTYEATNSSPINLSGYSEKDAKVKILLNGKEKTTTDTDKDGKFSIDRFPLDDGDNAISAILLKETKESPPSSPIHVTYKKTPPKLDILYPKDGDSIHDNKDINITGTTDPGSRVTINDRFVIVDSQGKFSFAFHLSDGDNMLKIIATDTAGNQEMKEMKVNYSS
jgi:hypothetical protein